MMVLFCCYFSCHFTLLWHLYDGVSKKRKKKKKKKKKKLPLKELKSHFRFFVQFNHRRTTHTKTGPGSGCVVDHWNTTQMFLQVVWLVQLGTRLLLPPPILERKVLQTDSSANLLEFSLGRKELPLDCTSEFGQFHKLFSHSSNKLSLYIYTSIVAPPFAPPPAL